MIRNRIGVNHSAFSLVEILGAAAVLVAVAVVSVTSLKDGVLAGQRTAVQRELKSLNLTLQNFKAAGGNIRPDSNAKEAIQQLRDGVDLGTAEFAPLAEDPDWTKKVGGSTYDLAYDENEGFSYKLKAATGSAPPTKSNPVLPPSLSFDPSDPVAALKALDGLKTINPEDPAYAATLEAINTAYTLGTLSEKDLTGAGLEKYDGSWMSQEGVQQQYAQEAIEFISSGGTWADLSDLQKAALAGLYPSDAVAAGGAGALNLMDQTTITMDLVTGYAPLGGMWVEFPSYDLAALLEGADFSIPGERDRVVAEMQRLSALKYEALTALAAFFGLEMSGSYPDGRSWAIADFRDGQFLYYTNPVEGGFTGGTGWESGGEEE